MDEPTPTAWVPSEWLAEEFGVFERTPWECDPISRDDVARAAAEPLSELAAVPWHDWPREAATSCEMHAQRIAYLARHWNADEGGIEIEFQFAKVDLSDGYHRLHAAVWRADELVRVNYSGYLDIAESMLAEIGAQVISV